MVWSLEFLGCFDTKSMFFRHHISSNEQFGSAWLPKVEDSDETTPWYHKRVRVSPFVYSIATSTPGTPQKSNVDTKNCHFFKVVTFSKPSFWGPPAVSFCGEYASAKLNIVPWTVAIPEKASSSCSGPSFFRVELLVFGAVYCLQLGICKLPTTVGGRNPTLVDMENITCFVEFRYNRWCRISLINSRLFTRVHQNPSQRSGGQKKNGSSTSVAQWLCFIMFSITWQNVFSKCS